jgi:hypothetical protein
MAAVDQFLLPPSVASFRHRPPILGSSSSQHFQLQKGHHISAFGGVDVVWTTPANNVSPSSKNKAENDCCRQYNIT